MRYLLTLLAAALLLTGCQATSVGSSTGTLNATVTASTCHARTENGQTLPDPSCTPGATNPAVTQANIGTTICASGWSTKERAKYLPESLSAKYKRQVEAAYGVPVVADDEGDHLIPIEVGGLPGPVTGAPAFILNYWPERNDHPKPGVLNSKDLVENALHDAVCSGRVHLADAQHAIASDWTTAEQRLGLT